MLSKQCKAFLIVLLVPLFFIACGTTPEKAKDKLESLGISYDENSFVLTASKGDSNSVDLFLKAGMKPDVLSSGAIFAFPTSPLTAAAKNKFIDTMKVLLKYGADVNFKDSRGMTALFWSVKESNNDSAIFLLKNGADPNIIPFGFDHPWIMAATNCNADVLKEMLAQNMDVDYKNKTGETALMLSFDTAKIALLLDNKANINAQDNNGWTALMKAALKNKTDAVKLLLEKKADITLKNKNGKTALDIAKTKDSGMVLATRDPELIKSLEKVIVSNSK